MEGGSSFLALLFFYLLSSAAVSKGEHTVLRPPQTFYLLRASAAPFPCPATAPPSLAPVSESSEEPPPPIAGCSNEPHFPTAGCRGEAGAPTAGCRDEAAEAVVAAPLCLFFLRSGPPPPPPPLPASRALSCSTCSSVPLTGTRSACT